MPAQPSPDGAPGDSDRRAGPPADLGHNERPPGHADGVLAPLVAAMARSFCHAALAAQILAATPVWALAGATESILGAARTVLTASRGTAADDRRAQAAGGLRYLLTTDGAGAAASLVATSGWTDEACRRLLQALADELDTARDARNTVLYEDAGRHHPTLVEVAATRAVVVAVDLQPVLGALVSAVAGRTPADDPGHAVLAGELEVCWGALDAARLQGRARGVLGGALQRLHARVPGLASSGSAPRPGRSLAAGFRRDPASLPWRATPGAYGIPVDHHGG